MQAHQRRLSGDRTESMTVAPHILVVDDDPGLRRMIAEYLSQFDMRVSGAEDSAAMHKALSQHGVDLILLDLKLQSEDGMAIARDLRKKSNIPIIMLTGRKEDADRIMGLEIGADDYLTKPFNLRELLARIRALLRRSQLAAPTSPDGRGPRAYRFSIWELDLRSRRLTSATGERVDLTHAEFALLAAFLAAPERILTREQLLELSRHDDEDVFDRSIDVQILRLRRKIEIDPSRPKLIRTERGSGYFFDASVEPVG
jgi:two-component system, OmpR family, response regulator